MRDEPEVFIPRGQRHERPIRQEPTVAYSVRSANRMIAEIERLTAERDAARTALDKVLALHPPFDSSTGVECEICVPDTGREVSDQYPCATVRAALVGVPEPIERLREALAHTCCACFTHNGLPCCNRGHTDTLTRPAEPNPNDAKCPHDLHFGGYYCEEPGCPGAVPTEPAGEQR